MINAPRVAPKTYEKMILKANPTLWPNLPLDRSSPYSLTNTPNVTAGFTCEFEIGPSIMISTIKTRPTAYT